MSFVFHPSFNNINTVQHVCGILTNQIATGTRSNGKVKGQELLIQAKGKDSSKV